MIKHWVIRVKQGFSDFYIEKWHITIATRIPLLCTKKTLLFNAIFPQSLKWIYAQTVMASKNFFEKKVFLKDNVMIKKIKWLINYKYPLFFQIRLSFCPDMTLAQKDWANCYIGIFFIVSWPIYLSTACPAAGQ